jgi:hypothetical protein
MAVRTSGHEPIGSLAPWRRLFGLSRQPLHQLSERSPLLCALSMFLASWLGLAWPWLSGRVTIPWDAKAHFLPQIQFLARSLADGDSPFWAPYVFGGHPQIADPQAMIFSPPYLALALFDAAPSAWALDAVLLIMILLGGAALMVWFRDQGWHWAGALMAALAFSFGASMAWRIQHVGQVLSLAYWPIALMCLDRALTRASPAYAAAAGVVTGVLVLGRDQVALLALYWLLAFAVWRMASAPQPKAAMRRNVPQLTVAATMALAVAIVPVALSVSLAADSNRPAIDYESAGRGSLHPALLLTFLAPHVFGAAGRMEDYWGPPSFAWNDTGLYIAQNVGQLYIGAIPILLLLLALASGLLWKREIRFVAASALVMGLYALGWYTPLFRLLYELVPGVSLFRRPADAGFFIGALTAILSGYAVHLLFAGRLRVARGPVLVAAATVGLAVLTCVGLGLWLDLLGRVSAPLTLAALSLAGGVLALACAKARLASQPWLAAAILAGYTAVDLGRNNGPNTSSALPPDTYSVLEPNTGNETVAVLKAKVTEGKSETRRDRVELVGLGFHWPNASLTHGLENTLGYNPLRLGLYSQATGAADHVGLPEQRTFAPLFPSYDCTLARLLGLRFIATGVPIESIDKTSRPGALRLIAKTPDAYIYENPGALPRVLFATQARIADFERLLGDGAWPQVDFTSTVLLERGVSQSGLRRPGHVRLVSYRNTEVVLEADSPDGGWTVLNDVWHPWWFADIDGEPVEVLRANVLFRAVAVPAGRHRVTFTFRPLAGAWADLHRRSISPFRT